DLAAVADVVDPFAFDDGTGADALPGPVLNAADLAQLVVHGLPEELAVGLVEAHDDALVDRLLAVLIDVARVARGLVVGADEHLAIGDGRAAVGLVAQLGRPLDVLLHPLLDAPVGRHALVGEVHQVALVGAAEHGPVRTAVAGSGVIVGLLVRIGFLVVGL